jgi:hypothetical protein
MEEMALDCESEDEAREYLAHEVQADFEQKVSFVIRNENSVIEQWREYRDGITS